MGLADQFEQMKISPFPLNTEEMSRFWTAMQAHYRPTFSFQVTVVLIRLERPAVRRAGADARPNVTPQTGCTACQTSRASVPPLAQPAPRLIGDTVTVDGIALADPAPPSCSRMTVQHPGVDRRHRAQHRPGVQFVLPSALPSNPAASWPVGVYQLSVMLLAGQPKQVTTNALPLVIAPAITTVLPMSVAGAGGSVAINLSVAPPVLQEQSVSLLLGASQVAATPLAATSSNLSFIAPVGPGHLPRARAGRWHRQLHPRSERPPARVSRRDDHGDLAMQAAAPTTGSTRTNARCSPRSPHCTRGSSTSGWRTRPSTTRSPMRHSPTAIDRLAEAFALTPFERELILLCAGTEMDARSHRRAARRSALRARPIRPSGSRWRC